MELANTSEPDVFITDFKNSQEWKCLESIFDKIAGLKACNLTYWKQ